jgi:hypothetical protein
MIAIVPVFAFARSLLPAFAKSQPYEMIIGLLLQNPFYRRYLYSPYVAYVRRELAKQREEANREWYVDLPARVEQSKESSVVPEPALSVVERIIQGRSPVRVCIESSGGRGKSALLRRIVDLLLTRFEKDGKCPLPVLVSPRNDTLLTAATNALARFRVSDNLLRVELESGLFIIVIDGMTELVVDPEDVREFYRGLRGDTPLMVSSRPNSQLRQSLGDSSEVTIVEPLSLDERSVSEFERHYLECDPESSALSPALRSVCRSPDGRYSPVLIRLALMTDHSEPKISELYRNAFRKLLTRRNYVADDELFAKAIDYCVKTYWKNGRRRLPYSDIVRSEYKDTLSALYKTGVLVPAQQARYKDDEPSEVVFFHDSMQSYLTAVGLLNEDPTCADLSFLKRAAGEQMFAEAASDLYYGRGSELFHMCVEVFPADQLAAHMSKELAGWGVRWGDVFSRETILSGTPPFALPEPAKIREITPEQLLTLIIGNCEIVNDTYKRASALGAIYARIAPLVVAEEQRKIEP